MISPACAGRISILALGFGSIVTEAGPEVPLLLNSKITTSFASTYDLFHWKNWQNTLIKLDEPATALRSLSLPLPSCAPTNPGFPRRHHRQLTIPWGFSKGDEDLGGYTDHRRRGTLDENCRRPRGCGRSR